MEQGKPTARAIYSHGDVVSAAISVVSPDTLLRWYRELIASKWNYSHRRGPGRPRVMMSIADLA